MILAHPVEVQMSTYNLYGDCGSLEPAIFISSNKHSIIPRLYGRGEKSLKDAVDFSSPEASTLMNAICVTCKGMYL